MKNRNNKILEDFIKYCKEHPQERFWQALRNWVGYNFIITTNSDRWMTDTFFQDTFYWEGKDK